MTPQEDGQSKEEQNDQKVRRSYFVQLVSVGIVGDVGFLKSVNLAYVLRLERAIEYIRYLKVRAAMGVSILPQHCN